MASPKGDILILLTSFAHAQRNYSNKFSLETSFGLNYPIAPTNFATPIDGDPGIGEFAGPKHFDIGARYMISSLFGFKVSYGYDRFQYAGSNFATDFYRGSFEAVFNTTDLFDIYYNRRRTMQIQLHGGVGLSAALSQTDTETDNIVHLIFGVRPMFKLSDRFALTTDLSYLLNFKQDYGYSGVSFTDTLPRGFTGGYVNFSVGLNFYIGFRRDNADFY
ncbi:hypothetical protein N9863_01425 [Flavobacteriaceae bacterium]|nr:hypothetical protein [Flavobacteriaceae bacterium]